jgi:hypothetical protein
MTDEEIIQSSERLGKAGHYELSGFGGHFIQCKKCKHSWDADILLDIRKQNDYILPCTEVVEYVTFVKDAMSASNTPFVPDPELFPLGDGSSLDEDTKPGRKQVESTTWQPFQGVEFVEKKCECGVDKTGGGTHSSWCPKAE